MHRMSHAEPVAAPALGVYHVRIAETTNNQASSRKPTASFTVRGTGSVLRPLRRLKQREQHA